MNTNARIFGMGFPVINIDQIEGEVGGCYLGHMVLGNQTLSDDGRLLYTKVAEHDNDFEGTFAAVDVWFREQIQITEREFPVNAAPSIMPMPEWFDGKILAYRRLADGRQMTFQQMADSPDTAVFFYDRSGTDCRMFLNVAETLKTFHSRFIVEFIDDSHILTMSYCTIKLWHFDGKKFECKAVREVEKWPEYDFERIFWRNNAAHIVMKIPSCTTAILTLQLKKPKSLLMTAHNAALTSHQKFPMPVKNPVQPLFGKNPYRLKTISFEEYNKRES